ncbi:MAG: iron-sulfur cluster co-chaperone HscB C-terminal domain-containing protein [Sphingobacteriia bacterium]|jgi:molecular chaperone HscB
MNHFELYKIPICFLPDLGFVKKQFYALSRQYHPDFFGGATEFEKEEALAVSAQINHAYKIFQDKEATIKYLLQLKGLLEEDEKYNLPSHFLMEVMELNEHVMELDPTDKAAIKLVETELHELQKNIYESVEPIITNFKDGISTEKELLQVKDYYFKKKYLDRIEQQLLSY